MATDSNIDELLAAQASLEAMMREYMTQLSVQLRTENAQAVRDKLNAELARMIPLYNRLTGGTISIIAVRTKNDVAQIQAVSRDVQVFVTRIKRIEKVIAVATAIVNFVAVCLTDTRDPVAIYKAGNAVYEAMNKTIDRESKKANSAVLEASLFTLAMGFVGAKGKVVVKKAPAARHVTKAPPKKALAKKPAVK